MTERRTASPLRIPLSHAAIAGPPTARRRAMPFALLALSVVFAAVAGVVYLTSAPPATGVARQAVAQAATREIADLNSVDYQHVAAAEARWGSDTTGAEHNQVLAVDPAAAKQIQQVKTSSAATVTALAVTSVTGGTASVIATVQIMQTASTGSSNTLDNRYAVTLTLTSAGWKISSLHNV